MDVDIPVGSEVLKGYLELVPESKGLVLFAHGSGSSRNSSRNLYVAKKLQEKKIATLLFDLLTKEEEDLDEKNGSLRFDIPFLSKRLTLATIWAQQYELPLGYFGASTGAAAALLSASFSQDIQAIVSRGGRPDLALEHLPHVQAATLLIVGGNDGVVVGMNNQAYEALNCKKALEVIEGATHLFEEEGKLEQVAKLASNWFDQYLKRIF